MAEKYFQSNGISSWVSLAEPGSPEADEIYRFRGKLYTPKELGGEGSYIADTDIRLVGEDLSSPATDFSELREFHPVYDQQKVPDHKLSKTAYFFVKDGSDIVVSGWLVPYSPETGIPMELAYKWDGYFSGSDEYLTENGIGAIDTRNSIEIGRLCSTKKTGLGSIVMAFRTLHHFLNELGVDNYFDAAMDVDGRRLASFYETIGMRKVELYTCDTVTGAKQDDSVIKPVTSPIVYWAQHMNVPHTQKRAKNGDYDKQPSVRNGAALRKGMLKGVAPYLFND
jgi:hypothetical protein